MDNVEKLTRFQPEHEFFIGIDSDGCVFDSMEIKQKECFCPAVIKHYGLQVVSKYAREVWEFVNLYSKTRGCNRFLAVQHCLNFLRERPEVQARGARIPELPELCAWTAEESKLGNPALEAKVQSSGSKELAAVYKWSLEVNERVADLVYGVPPFPGVREMLAKGREKADLIVVSQTPLEALVREWEENKLTDLVKLIAGQEYGTKTEHLKYAAGGKYGPDKVLMIGDAPGDFKAANANDALFFPVIPGGEEDSWSRLLNEGLEHFFNGSFAGAYQKQLLDEFDRALPEKPPWK